jgi:chloramphenicol-sensitive protein RarD
MPLIPIKLLKPAWDIYINPLLTIFLVDRTQRKIANDADRAVLLACIGVGIITFSFGRFRVIAMILALSFSAYSLVKKRIKQK